MRPISGPVHIHNRSILMSNRFDDTLKSVSLCVNTPASLHKYKLLNAATINAFPSFDHIAFSKRQRTFWWASRDCSESLWCGLNCTSGIMCLIWHWNIIDTLMSLFIIEKSIWEFLEKPIKKPKHFSRKWWGRYEHFESFWCVDWPWWRWDDWKDTKRRTKRNAIRD